MISRRKVVISPEQLRYMKLFQDMLGVNPRDVVEDRGESRLIFVVEKGDLGRAVGRGGRKLKMMKKFIRGDLDYDIEVVEFDDSPEGFLANLLSPARVQKVKIIRQNDGITAIAYIPDEDKSIAIGRNGRRIKRAKLLAKRWYDIDNIKIATWSPSNP